MDGQNYVGKVKLMKEIGSQQCIVYSFGISLGCYFEDEIFAFGCKLYTYDPAIIHNVQRSENVRHKIGVVVEPTKDLKWHTMGNMQQYYWQEGTYNFFLNMHLEDHK